MNPNKNVHMKYKIKENNLQLAHKLFLFIYKFHNKPFMGKCLYVQLYKREIFLLPKEEI